METLFDKILTDLLPDRISDITCQDEEIQIIQNQIVAETENITPEQQKLLDLAFSYSAREMVLAYELGFRDAVSLLLMQ